MSWVKLDDAILDNTKIIAAGPIGLLLHVAAITWCGRNLTDGFIPKRRVYTLVDLGTVGTAIAAPPACGPEEDRFDPIDADEVAQELAAIGLWHDRGDCWEIHDYLVYNPPREKVLARREHARSKKARQRVSLGMSPSVSPTVSPGDMRDCPASVPTHPVPVPQKKKILTSFGSKKKSSRLPADETLTPERLEMARSLGLTSAGASMQWAIMRDHEFFRPRVDWDATWRNWCRKVVASRRPPPPGPRVRDALREPLEAPVRLGELYQQFLSQRAPPNGGPQITSPQTPGEKQPHVEQSASRSNPRRSRE